MQVDVKISDLEFLRVANESDTCEKQAVSALFGGSFCSITTSLILLEIFVKKKEYINKTSVRQKEQCTINQSS